MATVRTVTVKSSGGDYTSLSGAEAGEQADLVTADRQLNIECYSMEDTTAVTIDGWTTDATRYISIYAPAGERHDGKWNTSKYRLVVSNDTGINIIESFVRIEGLQVKKGSSNDHDQACIRTDSYSSTGGSSIRIVSCILIGSTSSYIEQGLRVGSDYDTVYIINSIIYGCGNYNWSDRNAGITVVADPAVCYAYGCTVVNNAANVAGISRVNGTLICKNCYAKATTTTCYRGTITMTTCASADTTGSTGLHNIAVNTTNFTNVTAGSEDFHLPLGSALIDVGTDTSGDAAPLNFTTDIDGQTRSGTWDIGADEYVAAGVTGNPWYYYAQAGLAVVGAFLSSASSSISTLRSWLNFSLRRLPCRIFGLM